jgi:hypothetical protein
MDYTNYRNWGLPQRNDWPLPEIKTTNLVSSPFKKHISFTILKILYFNGM